MFWFFLIQLFFTFYYSGREAPSLKMGSVCFSYYFLGVDFQSLTDWLARRQSRSLLVGRSTVGQMTWCKWRRTKCGRVKCALLAQWTVGYNAHAAPILNCIWRFWLKLNSKCTRMNYEMNCIKPCTDVQKCTAMYSKRPEYTGECQSCLFIKYLSQYIIISV